MSSRPTLSATVLRLTAIALVAAVLIWSLLYIDALTKPANAGPTATTPGGQAAIPDAQGPAPVITRTS
jgi:hypothetical protein